MADDLKRKVVGILLRDENQVRIDRGEFDEIYKILMNENWITAMGDWEACSCLTQLLADELNVDISNIIQNLGYVPDGFAYRFRSLASIRIPDNVTSIGKYAFCDCASLKNVTIPDSVTTIGGNVFSGCGLLKEILLRGVQSIPSFAFSSTGIEKIVLCDQLKSIEMHSFSNCKSLKSIDLPSTLEAIGERAFYATPISDINYNGTSMQFKKIKKHRRWHEGCLCDTMIHCTDKDLIYK